VTATTEVGHPAVEGRAAELARTLEAVESTGDPRRFRRRLADLAERAESILRRVESCAACSSLAAEWLLDNRHIILGAVVQVGEDLTRNFYQVLPKTGIRGEPRIQKVAHEIVTASAGYVDLGSVRAFLDPFQVETPLRMCELWALPSYLRLTVLDRILDAASELAAQPDSTGVGADRISTGIACLRAIDEQDWKDAFEELSRVDHTLRKDPAAIYPRMDFQTRDRYRKAVEELSRWSGKPEWTVAEEVVARADTASGDERHVGHHLLGGIRLACENALGCRRPASARLRSLCFRMASPIYFGTIIIVTLALAAAIVAPLPGAHAPWPAILALLALVTVPTSAVAVALVNLLVTRLVPPRPLPKLDLSQGVPGDLRTCVVVPALLTDDDVVEALLAQLEMAHLGNRDQNVSFALLADPPDARREHEPDDDRLLEAARAGIRGLNARHGGEPKAPFALFYRSRTWNDKEGRWMGWERKRGKLHEFNRFVLGSSDTGLQVVEGDAEAVRSARFALTLDADTLLPRDSAFRLIGTLAHPLNRPRFTPDGRVHRGYTVLQPRVETILEERPSWFARILSADEGLDLYSHAVSDVYQDLFGEGIYAGKGLYEIGAFEHSLEQRVPENALLSHDLFEGVHGRAGLVSDVAVLEGFPAHPLAWLRRTHRWIRGDWQLLPWLLPTVPTAGGLRTRNRLSWTARWKIADNMRRSLLAPALVLLALLGWTILPGSAAWWTGFVAGVLAVPVFVGWLDRAYRIVRAHGERIHPLRGRMLRPLASWAVAFLLLAWEAVVAADAVLRTLIRLTITHRHLLEWTPAAVTSRRLATGQGPVRRLVALSPSPILALVAVGALALSGTELGLAVLLPLGSWLLVPILVTPLSRAPAGAETGLPPGTMRRRLRLHARRTWAFFEHFMGPGEHWLPPDHVQLEPPGGLAHRTSPTNIGLGVLSAQLAHDLGHVTFGRLIAHVSNALDTLDRLERHRGHFLNWYDTQRLAALAPRYVSTVDSGNLAAALIVLREALRELDDAPDPREEDVTGLADGLEVLAEAMSDPSAPLTGSLRAAAHDLVAGAARARVEAKRPADILQAVRQLESTVRQAEAQVADALPALPLEPSAIADVHWWVQTLAAQVHLELEDIEGLHPWLAARSAPPTAYRSPEAGWELGQAWARFLAGVPDTASLRAVPAVCERLSSLLNDLDACLAEHAGHDELRTSWWREASSWNDRLRGRLETAATRARGTLEELASLRRRIDDIVGGMDFTFLYDPRRRLLHVGYDVDSATLDRSYYDLYASESRLASYVAIAKGDVPVEHWLQLARPFGRRRGTPVLLSWGGSMFEYLLPGLFTRTPENSLADVACRSAVAAQIAYGREHAIPWGLSESAYADMDAGRRYRYRAFGVPALALHRDSTPRRVVAPYASALALTVRPKAAARNLCVEERMGSVGPLGFFDALDFGVASRTATAPTVVGTVMAHHQGMLLAAVHHVLTDGATVRRFHAAPTVSALEYLLHERPPSLVRPLPRLRRPAPPPARAVDLSSSVPWSVAPDAFPPETTVLSNGRLSTILTAAGAGGMRWNGYDVTRWRPDPTRASWGSWIYVLDRDADTLASATLAPTWTPADREEVVFSEESVEFHRDLRDLRLRLLIAVSAGSDVEIRRVGLVNESSQAKRVDLTSFAEGALARPSEDRRHPAFAKLFVEADFDPSTNTLCLARRSAGLDERPMFVAHRVLTPPGHGHLAGWAADRELFLGRLGDIRRPPGATDPSLDLRRRGPWAPLDPILSLTARASIPAGGSVVVTFLTAVGATRQAAMAALDTFHSDGSVTLALEQARDRERSLRQRLSMAAEEPREIQRLLSLLAYPYHRAGEPLAPGSRSGSRQDVLWSLGVSGDRPVVTASDARPGEGDALEQLLRAHQYLRAHGVEFDVVVVGREPDGYGEPMRTWVEGALSDFGRMDLLNAPGGVHYVSSTRLGVEARITLEEASCLVLEAGGASLAGSLEPASQRPAGLPAFVPVPSGPPTPRTPADWERTEGLKYFNGWGGFTPSGRGYAIRLTGSPTPAPWSNVLANPHFGTLVTESGGGFTWDGNSGESRLTPWSNDPVLDPPGEVVYLRDEETGEIWTPTPGPAGEGEHEVVHRADETTFRSGSHGLLQRLRIFVPTEGRVKVTELEMENHWPRPRRVTVTCYVEWVLGAQRWVTAPHVITGFLDPEGALVAENRFSWSSGARYAFLASDSAVHGFTCDRAEFLGQSGDIRRPAGLVRVGLARACGARLDPCGALQVHVDLDPGESRTVRFYLGAVDDPSRVGQALAPLRASGGAERARRETRASWDRLLETTTVTTPEPALDLLVNRWGLHQTVAARLWGRTGFYQSSGAFGFRDQLQDVMALLGSAPDLCRERIVDAARHQFMEGDVMHWWHPPTDRGVRTRCSDDRLWLPYVVARCVRALGAEGLLDPTVPFLQAPPLAPEESERYGAYDSTGPPATVLEHCLRALDVPDILSPRGVPLIGHGDWNDGLNRVGVLGRGESFWLAWFLYATLRDFARVCDDAGHASKGAEYGRRAEAVREAVETHGWDGAWYRRGTYDDGAPLGSVSCDEGVIDSLPQSWAVLSGAGNPERARTALDSVWQRLVDRERRIIRLLMPPYHRTRREPGYIKSYPPGVRENGGQYTHAAVWVGWAYAMLGDGDRAVEVFRLLSPILRTATPEDATRYRVEPYVLAGDVYGGHTHGGRGGWTWYTGSAPWLYRLATEAILGIEFEPGGLRLSPCIPRAWPGYRIVHRHGGATYTIDVESQPDGDRGPLRLTLDGNPLPDAFLPLVDDGREHRVRAVLGGPAGGEPETTSARAMGESEAGSHR
jgi:cyclic beta-1,2-glucan synthetase